jgi:hypothetical protein
VRLLAGILVILQPLCEASAGSGGEGRNSTPAETTIMNDEERTHPVGHEDRLD